MLKKTLKRLGVLALACVLAGLLAEGLVLLFLGEQVKFPRHVVGADWGLRYNLPGSEYRHKSPDVDVRFRINAQGMRADRDYAYEKPPGRLRILSLGDSFTIGYEVEVEECFSSVLERELRAMGYDVEVINAGVSGFSTAEACLYLERELIKYDPDLVVHSYYTNDIRDNVRSGLFDVDDDGQLIQTGESYVPMGDFANYLNTSRVFSLLSQYSNAFSFAKNATTNILKERMVDEQIEETAARKGIDLETWRDELHDVEHNEVEPLDEVERPGDGSAAAGSAPSLVRFQEEAGEGEGAESKPALQPVFRGRILCCQIYERMFAFLNERGVKLVIQSIPYQGDDKEQEGAFELIDTFPSQCFNSRRRNVSVVYAKRYLDAQVNKEPLYYLRSNRHWTPEAHEISGRALAHHIDRWKMLGEP